MRPTSLLGSAIIFGLLVPSLAGPSAAEDEAIAPWIRPAAPGPVIRQAVDSQDDSLITVVPYAEDPDMLPFRLTQAGEPRQEFESRGGVTISSEQDYLAMLSQIAPQIDQTAPHMEAVGSDDQAVTATTDPGDLLQTSNRVQTVRAQRRSPVSFDPHIRGYFGGQIYTVSDGAYWTPARVDLDSMLSKIDPTLIRDVVVIPGPYGLRYGPGFSFIDIQTYDSPRYQNGYEGHARLGFHYRANGDGMYGMSTLYGGSANYGYVFSYSNRTGNDYDIGSQGPINSVPSSYHNQNFWGQFGFDLSPCSNIEVRYQRLDQVDTEYAAQFFDVRYLVTDGFSIAYNHQSPEWDRQFSTEVWYNRTRFEGDTLRSNKRSADFPVVSRVDEALRNATGAPASAQLRGFTDGDVRTTGARASTLWGQDGCTQLRLGADVRFLEQHLAENLDVSDFPGLTTIQTNMPRAQMIDPGIYSELTMPVTPYWTTNVGGRVSWAHTTAEDEGGWSNGWRGAGQSSLSGFPGDRDQNDVLYAFYVTSDVDLNENWSSRVGVGHAQRSPTLIERYADGLFLGIIQNGFSRVIGTPALQKERAWQADLTFSGEFDSWRTRVSGFAAWIDNYITYEANVILDPSGARLLRAINTDYATLAGIEWYGEVDLTMLLTGFASLRYVDGRDQGIEQPLAQISPLESRVGLRIQDPCESPVWGGEMGFRMVDRQHREAFFRNAGGVGLVQVEDETPGFTTAYVRGFWNVRESFRVVGGVENLFDRTYVEHLDLRLPPQGAFPATVAYAPGITPYVGIEWER